MDVLVAAKRGGVPSTSEMVVVGLVVGSVGGCWRPKAAEMAGEEDEWHLSLFHVRGGPK